MYLGLFCGWFKCYLGLVQGFFRVGLGLIFGLVKSLCRFCFRCL